ncbi:hypothetical protein BH11MYX1_BH11MYX1_55000 [soil metagenome]
MTKLAYMFAASLIAGCATTGSDGSDGLAGDEQDSTTTYVQIQEFGTNPAEDAWYSINSKLQGEFNTVCGDTFCEGDFSNITALRLYCSVTSKHATIHDCAWAFTASTHEIDTKTAAVVPNAVTYQCHFKPKTTGPKLIALLQASNDAIHATLPGMGSIYDTLGACFDHPIGTPPAAVSPVTTTYVDAADYYASAAGQAKWAGSLANLHAGFDNVCGDTFCGSDYADVQALDLGCSVTRSSGTVKTCIWNFGGSYTTIAPNGNLAVVSKTWSCPVAVTGTIGQLTSVLTNTTDTADAIHRALPGGTSAYDSIAGCVTR